MSTIRLRVLLRSAIWAARWELLGATPAKDVRIMQRTMRLMRSVLDDVNYVE